MQNLYVQNIVKLLAFPSKSMQEVVLTNLTCIKIKVDENKGRAEINSDPWGILTTSLRNHFFSIAKMRVMGSRDNRNGNRA